MGVRRLAVGNGPNIFQMLLVHTCIAANADGPRDAAFTPNQPSRCTTELMKVSNSKSDVQTHLRSLEIVSFDKPYVLSYISPLL